MTNNQIAIVVAHEWAPGETDVAGYVIGRDTPPQVPADLRPVPSYTPFTQTPRSQP